jgi:hypothetical protein
MNALAQVSTQVFQQIKRAFPQGGVARNSSWLLSAELIAKVSRLLTIIALSSQPRLALSCWRSPVTKLFAPSCGAALEHS